MCSVRALADEVACSGAAPAAGMKRTASKSSVLVPPLHLEGVLSVDRSEGASLPRARLATIASSGESVYVVCLRVLKLLVCGNCDNSMREKDWRCCKRGTQAT
jgi:hypothetical protein